MSTDPIRTPRLVLRRWRDEDRAPFAALNADPEVMAYFPAVLTREQSDALVDRIEAHLDLHGYGLWAVQVQGVLAGFTGLSWTSWDAAGTPALEVGWRLARRFWGHGYASEAASAAVPRGLEQVETVVSLTATTNQRSRRVMERIGLRYRQDVDHPRLPEGHRLRRHVLYQADRSTWRPGRPGGGAGEGGGDAGGDADS